MMDDVAKDLEIGLLRTVARNIERQNRMRGGEYN
jgi:hypothetical protein